MVGASGRGGEQRLFLSLFLSLSLSLWSLLMDIEIGDQHSGLTGSGEFLEGREGRTSKGSGSYPGGHPGIWP